MIKQPPYLKKGDKVAIVCPAKSLPKSIDKAIAMLQNWGLEVILGETVSATFNQFAGSDELRTQDLQHFLDNPEIKAIIAGRGGYGTIRIIDQLDFTKFCEKPKWIVGFSDITVLLSHVYAQFGISSIHGQMPYTFESSTSEALASLQHALFGEYHEFSYSKNSLDRAGVTEGILVGGNLTLLTAIEGSVSEIDFNDKILFIEDVGEHEYAIDRLLRTLDRKGKLANLKGLIVGAFNEIEAEKIPFGQSPDEVISKIISKYNYPVCYQFPTGHIDNNKTMVIGSKVRLAITNDNITFNYL